MNASRAVGLAIGPLLFSKYIHERNLHYVFILEGLTIIAWAFVQHNFTYSLVSILIVGLLSTTLWSYTYYMIQKEIEIEFLGRVIAYNDMIFMISNISITLFVGYTASIGVELKYITIIMGIGFFVAGGYYAWFKKNYLE